MALIVVIDDDEAMRRLIVRTLTPGNHRLVEAPNGQDGMKLVGELKPDAVITDILMPQQEGIQTIREIRELAPEIKIIAMSGGGSSHNLMFLDVARAFGADAVLAKPFKPGELKDTVAQVLNGHGRAAE
jgi:two-component system, chemotaxis family, chemotaxis protein CheY